MSFEDSTSNIHQQQTRERRSVSFCDEVFIFQYEIDREETDAAWFSTEEIIAFRREIAASIREFRQIISTGSNLAPTIQEDEFCFRGLENLLTIEASREVIRVRFLVAQSVFEAQGRGDLGYFNIDRETFIAMASRVHSLWSTKKAQEMGDYDAHNSSSTWIPFSIGDDQS